MRVIGNGRDLETLEGERVTLEDLDRPDLSVFVSNTFPMTASSGSTLQRLHREFGYLVRFVLVQVGSSCRSGGPSGRQPASP